MASYPAHEFAWWMPTTVDEKQKQNIMFDALLEGVDKYTPQPVANESDWFGWDAEWDPYVLQKRRKARTQAADMILLGPFRMASEYDGPRDWVAGVQNILKANDPRMKTIHRPKPVRALPYMVNRMEEAAQGLDKREFCPPNANTDEKSRELIDWIRLALYGDDGKATTFDNDDDAPAAQETSPHTNAVPFAMPQHLLHHHYTSDVTRFLIADMRHEICGTSMNAAHGGMYIPRQASTLTHQVIPSARVNCGGNNQGYASVQPDAASSPSVGSSWSSGNLTIAPIVTPRPKVAARRPTPGPGALWGRF